MSNMDGKEQRIAKLNAVQQQRKQDCIDRIEKAISKLLRNNERVSLLVSHQYYLSEI